MFTGEYVSHILELEGDEFWRLKFKNQDTTRQIRVRIINIQSWHRDYDTQIVIATHSITYGLEGDSEIINRIEASLEAVT